MPVLLSHPKGYLKSMRHQKNLILLNEITEYPRWALSAFAQSGIVATGTNGVIQIHFKSGLLSTGNYELERSCNGRKK